MDALYAIGGAGWTMSFQRRVGAANRGALPCVRLGESADRLRVLVPLHKAESLWIAVLAEASIAVSGRAGDDPLRVAEISGRRDARTLYGFDAVIRAGEELPLDAVTLDIVDDDAELKFDALTVTFQAGDIVAARIGIVVATPRLYASVSGLPPPPPSSAADQYGGWRLP